MQLWCSFLLQSCLQEGVRLPDAEVCRCARMWMTPSSQGIPGWHTRAGLECKLCWLWIRMSEFQCKHSFLGLRTSFYGLLWLRGLCLHRCRILLPEPGAPMAPAKEWWAVWVYQQATRIFWSRKYPGYNFTSEVLVEMPFPVMRLPLCCMTPGFSISTMHFKIKHSIWPIVTLSKNIISY